MYTREVSLMLLVDFLFLARSGEGNAQFFLSFHFSKFGFYRCVYCLSVGNRDVVF